jgi:hypothetical protein
MTSSTERAIGELKGTLDALVKTVEGNAAESKIGRQKVYEALQNQSNEVVNIRHDVEQLKGRLDVIEPKLGMLDRWRERGIGAWMLLAFIFSSIGALVTYFAKPILAKLGL